MGKCQSRNVNTPIPVAQPIAPVNIQPVIQPNTIFKRQMTIQITFDRNKLTKNTVKSEHHDEYYDTFTLHFTKDDEQNIKSTFAMHYDAFVQQVKQQFNYKEIIINDTKVIDPSWIHTLTIEQLAHMNNANSKFIDNRLYFYVDVKCFYTINVIIVNQEKCTLNMDVKCEFWFTDNYNNGGVPILTHTQRLSPISNQDTLHEIPL